MRRARDIVGAQMMDVHSGEMIGVVSDLFFDREGRLQGLLLEKKQWFGAPPFLPVTRIHSIGEDLVMANGAPEPLPEDKSKQWYALFKGDQHMTGHPVVTSNGKQLGILEDVYFQEKMGNIIGYEISDGFLADLTEGRHVVQHPDKIMFGKDAFVIHQSSAVPHADFRP